MSGLDVAQELTKSQSHQQRHQHKQLESFEYIEPFWASLPTPDHSIEVVKDGVLLEEKELKGKSFFLLGRCQDRCDFYLENPTVQPKNTVLQCKDTGEMFLYDLGTPGGTFVNKKRIPSKEYIKIKVGDIFTIA